MVEFKLNPKPTFKADVTVPRPGDEDGVLTFTFKHKKRTQLELLEKSLRETLEQQSETGVYSNEPMADFLMEICAGWALPDEFNRENMLVLLDNYPRAFDSIATLFTRELMAARGKN
ncbi:phage tail assembly chaperone [Serratia silvae]